MKYFADIFDLMHLQVILTTTLCVKIVMAIVDGITVGFIKFVKNRHA